MSELELSIIVAFDEDRAIGANGDIPWHYPEDLRHFKETTTGHPVIAGRETYENIVKALGEPLPNRTMVVLSNSRTEYPDGVHHASSIEDAIDKTDKLTDGTAYVIGGRSVYEQTLPITDELVITRVSGTHGGDTFFPEVNLEDWTQQEKKSLSEDLTVEVYRRELD